MNPPISNPDGSGTPTPGPPQEPNWLDRQARSYQDWMYYAYLLCCCCAYPGLIAGIVLALGCKTDEGKSKGQKLLLFSLAGVFLTPVVWRLFRFVQRM